VRIVDGHDLRQLTDVLTAEREAGKPACVIANTTKGCGISFMEDVVKWHHGVPSEAEYAKAVTELDGAERMLEEAVR
jgi:transketolase